MKYLVVIEEAVNGYPHTRPTFRVDVGFHVVCDDPHPAKRFAVHRGADSLPKSGPDRWD